MPPLLRDMAAVRQEVRWRSIIGHFQPEALDHLKVFSIEGYEGERLFHWRR